MLKELLKSLKNGNEMVIETIENQYGDQIPTEILLFVNGVWVYEWLECNSSSSYGFGTCGCHSHNAFNDKDITNIEALELIKKYISNEIDTEIKKENSIEMLDKWIKEIE